MRLWGLFAVAALSACYRAPHSDEACTITCSGAPGSCPGDLACEGGYCVAPGQVCRPAFVHVAAGTGFGCGIDDAGALWCWGRLTSALATRIDTSRHWQLIDGGGEQICGIADGHLLCWGGAVATPTELAVAGGPASWTAVSVGAHSACAIGDGRMWCWGANDSGQLGDGTQSDRAMPAPVSTAVTDWVAMSIGGRHACAISQSAGVYCWGADGNGQAGPNAANPQLVPVEVGVMATAVAVSASASCATSAAGDLTCWGDNGYGELGENNQALGQSATPVAATASKGWSAVAASEDTLCGVRDGEVVCWGSTVNGGLGNGFWTQARSDKAFAVVTGTPGTTELALGWNERVDEVTMTDARDLTLACALIGSDIACWGDNRFGQLAMGAATMALEPTQVAGDHAFSDLEVGLAHACAIESGVVWCWGSTELGAATGVLAGSAMKACNPNLDCDVATPKSLNFFSPDASALALGAYHTCAFHSGVITCWGDNSAGQLVSNTPSPPRERDIPAPGGATWNAILQTGRLGQCGVYRSGSSDATACWGNVLGPRTIATPIAALDGVTGFALGSTGAGTNFDCILDATGALECQGDNSVGQYGDGTTTAVTTLTAVSPARSYVQIATNTLSPTVCGVRGDGGVECWGQNDRGQTGSSVSTPTLTPNQLPGLTGCTHVAVGRWHACAACSGSVSCWGDNRFGQLGTGRLDAAPQVTPQQISGPVWDGAVDQLVAGYRFTCARAGTSVKCWGFDAHAGLGDGARSANLPVIVKPRPAQ